MSLHDSPSDVRDTVNVTAERIVALLWRKKMSMTALGRRVGMSSPSISQKMKGDRRWFVEDLVAVAAELDTSVGYLLGETDDDAAPKTTAAPSAGDGADRGRLWESNPRPIHYE